MSDRYHGGPAFPLHMLEGERWSGQGSDCGMTLRDYMAAKAMQGMMANKWNTNYTEWAEHAYRMADAMLKVRDQ